MKTQQSIKSINDNLRECYDLNWEIFFFYSYARGLEKLWFLYIMIASSNITFTIEININK